MKQLTDERTNLFNFNQRMMGNETVDGQRDVPKAMTCIRITVMLLLFV